MMVMDVKTYFKVDLTEIGKMAYICADDISSVMSNACGELLVKLKDERMYSINGMDYVPEATVDMQYLIKRKDKEVKKVPASVIEFVKEKNGDVSLGLIKDYISTKTLNILWRRGVQHFDGLLRSLNQNRLFTHSSLSNATLGKIGAEEVLNLLLQMDLIERKNDREYKPLEGYISKIPVDFVEEVVEDEPVEEMQTVS